MSGDIESCSTLLLLDFRLNWAEHLEIPFLSKMAEPLYSDRDGHGERAGNIGNTAVLICITLDIGDVAVTPPGIHTAGSVHEHKPLLVVAIYSTLIWSALRSVSHLKTRWQNNSLLTHLTWPTSQLAKEILNNLTVKASKIWNFCIHFGSYI